MRKRARSVTLAVSILVGATLVAAPPALANGQLSRARVGTLPDYATVLKVSTQLQEALQNTPGYGSVVLNPDRSGEMSLYWKGQTTAAVESAVAKASTTATHISILSAAYSRAELLAERDRLQARSAAGIAPHIYVIGPRPDDSGLTVTVARGSAAYAATLGQTLSSELGARIPVTISEGDAPIAADREDDTSPIAGGAAVRQEVNFSLCSTGPRVYSGTTYYMLTAWHCSGGGNYPFYTWPSAQIHIGNTNTFNRPHDIALIQDPPAGVSYSGEIYEGPWQGATRRAQTGAGTASVGAWICTEGGFTGEVCQNQVTQTDEDVDYQDLGWVYGLTRSDNVVPEAAGGEGDSGSPIIADTSGAFITNMFDGINPPFIECIGNPAVSYRQCSATVFSVPQFQVSANFGVAFG